MFINEQPEIPYKALNYVVADVNYGGRVTDAKDKVLISSLLHRYFTPEIQNDNYKLSKLDTYYAPPDSPIEEALAYIRQLPLDEDPEIFGLHSNANIVYEQNQVAAFMDTVLSIQPRLSSTGAAKTPEEIATDIAKDIQARLPKPLNMKKACAAAFALTDKNVMNSMGVFLSMEIQRFNKLLAVLSKSLSDLQQAIQGTLVMSMELEAMFNCFLDSKVPANWKTVAYPCLKPLASWIADMIARFEFMSAWCYEKVPISFWLPAFFFPQGFMTAAL